MTRILAIAALAALSSAPALGQAPAEKPAAAAPAPQAEKPAAVAPAPQAEKPAAQGEIKLVQGAGQSKVTEDARRCLEMSTNTDIIKCAEPYLPAKR